MNKEEILAMEAGKELDHLVATKVMGWTEWRRHGLFGLFTRDFWVEPIAFQPPLWMLPQQVSTWHPSTDLPTAWQVVEEMSKLGYNMSLLHRSSKLYPDYWDCEFRPKGSRKPPAYEWVYHQETAPLAICKAALLTRLEGGTQ